ncbi:MAG: hypothetical protein JNN30_14370 [Rhodanobacteraceae bacterium]|nr:hypothetical protein [Rhodanobacteraceae bacterium]
MPSFLYEATDRSGQQHAGRVHAETLAAARDKLELQGCREIRFHTDAQSEAIGRAEGHGTAEGVTPAQELSARRERPGSLTQLVAAYRASWIIWFPLTAWAAWKLYLGSPFGFGAWAAFMLAAVGLLFPVWAFIPSLLYARLYDADAWARWAEVTTLCNRALAWQRWFRFDPMLIDAEIRRAAARAALGDLQGALHSLQHLQTRLPRAHYLARVAAIYEAAQDWRGLAEQQAQAVDASGRGSTEVVDLATTLVWRLRRADDAAALLDEIRDQEMAVLPRAYFEFASGLVALERGEYQTAQRHIATFIDTLAQSGAPGLYGYLYDYANAFLAITHAALGQKKQAAQLLRSALPRLTAFRDIELTKRCQAALLGR